MTDRRIRKERNHDSAHFPNPGRAQHVGSDIEKRLTRVERTLGVLMRTRVAAPREEHERVIAALRSAQDNARILEQHTRALEVQFTRTAQLQAEVDELKRSSLPRKLPV